MEISLNIEVTLCYSAFKSAVSRDYRGEIKQDTTFKENIDLHSYLYTNLTGACQSQAPSEHPQHQFQWRFSGPIPQALQIQ